MSDPCCGHPVSVHRIEWPAHNPPYVAYPLFISCTALIARNDADGKLDFLYPCKCRRRKDLGE